MLVTLQAFSCLGETGNWWLLMRNLRGKLFQKIHPWTIHTLQMGSDPRSMHAFPNMRNIRWVKEKMHWGENRWGFEMRSEIICFSSWLPYPRLASSLTYLMKNPMNKVGRIWEIQLTETGKCSWDKQKFRDEKRDHLFQHLITLPASL